MFTRHVRRSLISVGRLLFAAILPAFAACLLPAVNRLAAADPLPAAPGPAAAPAAPQTSAAPTQDLKTAAGERVAGLLVVTHGGAGAGPEYQDGAQAAADTALAALRRGAGALDGAIAGVVVMENDCRFNAGTGANIRIDGHTIQMDASVMTDDGRFAAVAAIERVLNPILVARAVLDTPHILLVGEGATRFARRLGFADVLPTCPEAERKYRVRLKRVEDLYRSGGEIKFDWLRWWNFPGELPPELKDLQKHGDTVGAVTRGADGHFAAALSTGGTSLTLYGRVGDVPIYGAGLFAGPAGAVACTGDGEIIVKESVARTVYQSLAAGVTAEEAVARAVRAFPAGYDLGVIAVDREGWGVACDLPMACGVAH